jgi:hypothetical protein
MTLLLLSSQPRRPSLRRVSDDIYASYYSMWKLYIYIIMMDSIICAQNLFRLLTPLLLYTILLYHTILYYFLTGKYTALLSILIVGSFIIPMAQYFWYVRDDDSSDRFFAEPEPPKKKAAGGWGKKKAAAPAPEPPKKKGWFNKD